MRRPARVVVMSDPHLDASTLGVPRYDDLADAAWQAVQYAVDCKADLFLCLGDLGDPDTQRTHLAAAAAVEMAKRLEREKIPSRWVCGNHDVVEDGSGASVLEPLARVASDYVHVYAGPAVEWMLLGDSLVDVDLVALPYAARSHAYDPEAFARTLPGRLSATSRRVLVLGHLNLEGIGPGSETIDMPRGREVFWPLAALEEGLRGREALLLAGHYHRRQVFRGVHVVGSTAQFTFGELDVTPGFTVVEVRS